MARACVLSEVFIIVITCPKGEDEGICAMCVSRGGVDPTHNPDAEGECIVNPVFGVIVFLFAWSRLTP